MGLLDVVRSHPSFSSGVGGAVIGAGAVAIAGRARSSSKKKATRRKSVKKRKKATTRKTKRKASGTFKKRRAKALRGASPKKIFKTKNGQPYIKLKSGKARFISKRAASNMRKRKGGFS